MTDSERRYIVVVDSDAVRRRRLADFLEEAGHAVTAFPDPESVLEAIAAAPAAEGLPPAASQTFEHRFREMLENLHLIAVMLDRDGNITFANRFLLDLTGWRLEEALGRNWFDSFLPADETERVRAVHQRSVDSGEPADHFENDIVTRAGERRAVAWSNTVLRNHEGRIYGSASIGEDVTDRRRAQQALLESDQRLQAIIDQTSALIYVKDLEGRLTLVNRSLEAFFGASRESLLGRTSHDLLPAEIADAHRANDIEVMARGEAVSFEEEAFRPDGRHTYLSVKFPLHDTAGNTYGLCGISSDITRRRQTEDALREQTRLSQILLDSMPCVALLLRPQTREIVASNRAAVEVGAVPGATCFSTWAQSDCPCPWCLGPKLWATGEPQHLEVEAGGLSWEAHWIPVSRDLYMHYAFDITSRRRAEQERVRLEEQLRQAQKLESLGRLAGGVAHDFNNLLTVINGYTELILGRLRPGDPLQIPLTEVRKAGASAAQLTRQLLAFSRKQIIAPVPVDLGRMVADSRDMLQRLVGEHVELEINLAPGLGTVMADPSQLLQVLMNLAVNARDAMPGGGRLSIDAANREVGGAKARGHEDPAPGAYVVLTVGDTGTGMDEQTRQHIFEPFFTTKDEGRGAGLGLATVYGIVRQCGGYVEVASRAGEGASFSVYLPRVQTAGPAHEPAPLAVGAPRGAETVLVVEDQADVRRLVVDILADNGYHILEASGGDEALAQVQRHSGPIHLLLTDVAMAGMTGRDLAERLRPLHPAMPVLFMSGYTDDGTAQRAAVGREVGTVSKPFAPDALAQKVRQMLGPPRTARAILVVDDEEGVRNLFGQILTGAGYEVCLAPDGARALELVRARPFDAVLTDLVMPEREGIETIRIIRRERPGLRIIAVSGAFQGRLLKAAEALGADASLLKPVTPQDLLAAIRKLFD